ncbi:MAG: multicopper oxidase domain-containing protein [Gammaproteobacteria bacterium]|nr:multicopper oxidase domain-containing protein [Gammaproteobacteria bacterium]
MFNKFQEIYIMSAHRGGGGGTATPPPTTTGGRAFTFLRAPTTVTAQMNGSAALADGASISTWYFSNGGGFNGDRTVPSPVIEANQGEQVAITLSSMMPHTIHLHGLDVDQQNDGVPATSFEVTGSYTYRFTATHAGTFMYHCHVDTNKHMEMGMFGTIIIRPSNGSTTQAWDNGSVFDKEYLWQLTTHDSTWHSGMGGGGSNLARYRPDYFMINGKDGANTITDSATAITASAGQKVLVRIVGTSYMPGIIRMGSLPFEVIASDGRPLVQPYITTEQMCAAGERYDILLTMPSSGQYTGGIEYRNIRNTDALGTVTTTITVA